jgi:phosphate transport system substrate-binding protein
MSIGAQTGRPPIRFLLLLPLILASACARTPPPAASAETLVIVTSSAVSPLLDPLVQAFETQNPSISVIVETQTAPLETGVPLRTGAAQGIAQDHEESATLVALAGSPPEGVWAAPIAVDAIAVVVHPSNPLDGLTLAQLYDVFSGQTWHWSELGARNVRLAEDEITVLSRQEGSRTRAAFEAQVMAQGPDCQPIGAVELGAASAERSAASERPPCEPDPVTSTALLRMDSTAVVEYVAAHPGAIGYVAHGHLDGAPVKTLRVEDALPASANVADGSYRLSLPLYLVAPDEPTGAARQFVDYCLGARGQALVARQYVPARTE